MAMTPALTAEEWAGALAGKRPDLYRADDDTPEDQHKAAALYLYGQPFGFTREDVRMLREAVNIPDNAAPWLNSITDRIEALLPPEGV